MHEGRTGRKNKGRPRLVKTPRQVGGASEGRNSEGRHGQGKNLPGKVQKLIWARQRGGPGRINKGKEYSKGRGQSGWTRDVKGATKRGKRVAMGRKVSYCQGKKSHPVSTGVDLACGTRCRSRKVYYNGKKKRKASRCRLVRVRSTRIKGGTT